MRAVELARVAASAEALALRRLARRQGIRAAFGAGAAVFALATLSVLHLVGYNLLRNSFSPVIASLILLGIDLVLTLILAFFAMRNSPDAIEREAVEVRQQAVAEMKRAVTLTALVGTIGGSLVRRRARQPGRSRAWLVADVVSRVLSRR
jgi:hypothetical protein